MPPVLKRIAVAALALAALYTAYWYLAADRFAAAVDGWIAAQQHQGAAEIFYRDKRVGGFPLRFEVRLAEPRANAAVSLADVAWRAEWAAVQAPAWRPLAFEAAVGGRQEVVVVVDGRTRLYEIAGGPIRLRPARGGDGADLAGEGLYVAGEGIARPIAIEHGRLVVRQGEAVTATLDLVGVSAPTMDLGALDRPIERLTVELEWQGRLPDAPLPVALAAWRDDGGVLQVRRLFLRWGQLVLNAEGTAALDGALRPLAAFSTAVQGLETVADALAAAQHMAPMQAAAFKVALRVLGRGGADGQGLQIPATAQDGRLFIGTVPVARLGPVVPPGP